MNKESTEFGGKMSLSKEDAILNCLERKRRRYEFLKSKCLGINNGSAYSKIMICANVTDLSSSWEM